jgi:hypothetical protein
MWQKSNIKEGRHVGLDFYDLLIEGHYRLPVSCADEKRNAIFRFRVPLLKYSCGLPRYGA